MLSERDLGMWSDHHLLQQGLGCALYTSRYDWIVSAPAGGAGGGTTYDALRKADEAWKRLRIAEVDAPLWHCCIACSATSSKWSNTELFDVQMSGPAPEFVRTTSELVPGGVRFDVVVAGATLGIFLACVLQLQGFK